MTSRSVCHVRFNPESRILSYPVPVEQPRLLDRPASAVEHLTGVVERVVFHNDENGRINVVFKKDRGYGLVDPRLA